MQVYYAVVLLLLLTVGCTRAASAPPASAPQIAVTQADTRQVPAERAALATPPAEPAAAPAPIARPAAPAPSAKAPAPEPAAKAARRATPAASSVAPPFAKTPTAAPELDLKTLEEQLRGTKAIGVFTKIALKNQVDDLLDRFRKYYQGKAKLTVMELRRSYDLLMMKVLSLLQDKDEKLASAIVSSREAIWGLLADPTTFATLESRMRENP
jgi:hypothetical protein